MASAALQNPGNGFDPFTKTQKIGSTNAVTKGDVGVVRETLIDATSGLFRTVIQPATADLESGIFVVATEDIAAGEVGWWGITGVFDVLCNGAIALGEDLGPVNAQDYVDQTGAAAKIIAKPTEIQGSGTGLVRCYFDGWSGFGNDNA